MLHSIGRWMLVGIALACSVTVSAQTSCRDDLAQAQSLYIRGAFSEVEAMLDPCLQLGRLGEDDRVLAYRLLALSALKQGRLIEAKIVALSLLNLRPDYEPDAALDPPPYADLIHTVRSQLAVSRTAPVVEVDTSRLPPYGVGPEPISPPLARQPVPFVPVSFDSPARGRRSAPLELSFWSGDLAFSGDINRNNVLDGYLTSDGPRLGMQASYVPASWVAFGLGVEGTDIYKFPVERRTYQQAGRRVGAIIGIATLDMRMRAWPGAGKTQPAGHSKGCCRASTEWLLRGLSTQIERPIHHSPCWTA